MIYFVNIDYDEQAEQPYQAVTAQPEAEGSDTMTWASGDPVVDWVAFLDWRDSQDDVTVLFLSSVDHFVMDIQGYRFDRDSAGRALIVPDLTNYGAQPGTGSF